MGLSSLMPFLGFGFELETQSYQGFTRDDVVSGSVLQVGKDLDVVFDESISGVEIITSGRNTHEKMLECLSEAFKSSMEVDSFCGFHIHIDAPFLLNTSSFRRTLHKKAIDLHRLIPMCCYERLRELRKTVYFPFTDEETKYSFISYREEYGTYEFRFYGNVRTEVEALCCLNHSISTVLHAVADPEPAPTIKQLSQRALGVFDNLLELKST